ncbi:hypothetical protein [Floricoccus penangensis]|uniref:hypothetical protein n=1 Tax=Floricoccus penangensis TaxID=1859475 RepID=UPI00203D9B44|nr:hypothetical protein [Floricoccus penangensis]URZ87085.1 hypothetical protein KIW23_08355 [Floricoccus penangensis]
MYKKSVRLSSNKISQYKDVVSYNGNDYPKSYFLTLWQEFDLEELNKHEHFLLEQNIGEYSKIIFDREYLLELERVDVVKKANGQIWQYKLSLKEGERLYIEAFTKLYVRVKND